MIFHSSIRRELMRSFSATLFVLVIILITMMLIRTLGYANKGYVSPQEVSLVMGYTVLAYFPALLTLSLFVSAVYCFSRMYRDSEMAVWFSSGQGLLQFLQPLLRFALPVLLLVALLSLVGWPWANTQIVELRNRYQNRGDIERIAPGQFIESSDGNRVFYVDAGEGADIKNAATARAGKLFAFSREADREVVVSAHGGRLEARPDGRFVVLNNGQSTEIGNDQTLTVSRFEEMGVRLDAKTNPAAAANAANVLEAAPRTISSRVLLRQPAPHLQAEIGWRLGMTFAGINFLLIALATANVNPRSGRSSSLVLALLFFATYYNLINAGRGWVENETLPLWPMLALLHGGVFVLAVAWLVKRHRQWSFRSLLRGSGKSSPSAAGKAA